MKRKHFRNLGAMLLIILVAGCCGPVKDVGYHPSCMITIRDSLKTMRFALYVGDKPGTPKNGKHYYWYGNNRIHITEGDYSGKLLDGTYMEFDNAGGLIQKGTFYRGMKNGRWVTWNSAGEVKYCLKYHHGTAKDTTRTNFLVKFFSVKKDTTIMQPKKEKNEKSKRNKESEKEKAGKQK
jgi:hypothetical protein